MLLCFRVLNYDRNSVKLSKDSSMPLNPPVVRNHLDQEVKESCLTQSCQVCNAARHFPGTQFFRIPPDRTGNLSECGPN